MGKQELPGCASVATKTLPRGSKTLSPADPVALPGRDHQFMLGPQI